MQSAAGPLPGWRSEQAIRHFAGPENMIRSQQSRAIVEGHL
jgi:hypothetical protein